MRLEPGQWLAIASLSRDDERWAVDLFGALEQSGVSGDTVLLIRALPLE